MSQEQRDRVMTRLRGGTSDLLVATDVAARGLDVEQLTHVVNYDVPSAPDAYVHRIGRVGRAGREGVAITLAEPREHRMLKNIERVTGQRIEIEKVPTVADLRARRLEMTARHAARGDPRRASSTASAVVVETLADEFDVDGGRPRGREAGPRRRSGARPTRRRSRRSRRRVERPARARGRAPAPRPKPRGRGPAGETSRACSWARGAAPACDRRTWSAPSPGESRLTGRDIGAIEIFDRFSLVEVPAAAADEVIAGLRASTIKGKQGAHQARGGGAPGALSRGAGPDPSRRGAGGRRPVRRNPRLLAGRGAGKSRRVRLRRACPPAG